MPTKREIQCENRDLKAQLATYDKLALQLEGTNPAQLLGIKDLFEASEKCNKELKKRVWDISTAEQKVKKDIEAQTSALKRLVQNINMSLELFDSVALSK